MQIIPPHDLDAERSVLGAIMIAVDQSVEVSDAMAELDADCWYLPGHGKIYAAMEALAVAETPIDALTVKGELAKAGTLADAGGSAYLCELTDVVATAVNVAHYAKSVRGMHTRRQTIAAADAVIQAALTGATTAGEIASDGAAALADLATGRGDSEPVGIMPIVQEEFLAMEKRRKGEISGLCTGFSSLDAILGGLTRDDLVVIAARPGMGKTALALNISANVAKDTGEGVLVFSLEMSKEQLGQRIICAEAKISADNLRSGNLRQSEHQKFLRLANELQNSGLVIDDGSTTSVIEMRAKARRQLMRGPLALIVVDYIQLMSGRNSNNRERDVAEITRGLKNLGKEVGCPVVALSQLNRGVESTQTKRPTLSSLRESGAIEQDASRVIFIYRDDYYDKNSQTPGEAEIIVAKNRSGAVDECRLKWRGEYTRFDTMGER